MKTSYDTLTLVGLNWSPSIMERFMTGDYNEIADPVVRSQIERRRILAKIICEYLDKPRQAMTKDLRVGFCNAIMELLGTSEYRRILLYLPFEVLQEASQSRDFCDYYMNAWRELLDVLDARESFFEGDVFEPDARPDGELERVVKAVHLLPWLMKYGLITFSELATLMEELAWQEGFLRSVAESLPVIDNWGLLTKPQIAELRKKIWHILPRKKLSPLYKTEKRKIWLREKGAGIPPLVTPQARLDGSFVDNLEVLSDELFQIQTTLRPREIVVVGGSRLRGYGTEESDWDICSLEQLKKSGDIESIVFYFSGIWLGGEKVNNLTKKSLELASAFFGSSKRTQLIEKLESSLLLYRLLHKGFHRRYPNEEYLMRDYPELDGNCPFYNDNYRRIATKLYAKYVFIPF